MRQTLVTVVVLGFALACCGCGGSPREAEVKSGVEDKEVLTADSAKRALLEMDARQIPPGVLVPAPKDEPIETVGPQEISVGGYHCRLKEKTFHAEAFYPMAP